jgi:uncharacterized protein
MSIVYLDSSAFVKLIAPEPETSALRRYLRGHDHWLSASLLRAEVLRAAQRTGKPQRLAAARRQLRHVAYVDITRELLDQAGLLQPQEMRTLDALHLAAALWLQDDLDELVTYDSRMAHAAEANGLVVATPS